MSSKILPQVTWCTKVDPKLYNAHMEVFGINFKTLRLIEGKTQVEMGRILNVTHAAISHWETGKKIPEVPMLISIAKYFDVSIDYLLGLED